MYDYLIITHLPAFYKVNLYNELSKSLKIFVIFLADNTKDKRASDFVTLNKCNFKYQILSTGDFQNRKKVINIFKLRNIIKEYRYSLIILSGWDLLEFWYLAFTNKVDKNCFALESTVLESQATGVKAIIKRLFLKRISTVFASGNLHIELLKRLGYKKKIIITRGVGIINKSTKKIEQKEYDKSFLFIGRLSVEKNLKLIIRIFNELPGYTLTIVGDGPLKEELEKLAGKNIKFKNPIKNEDLITVISEHNILILPSISEPWGLVIEEALYYGMPVLISTNCGSVELVKNGFNGFIFDPLNFSEIKRTILKIDDSVYKKLIEGVKAFSIDEKDIKQIQSYKIG